MRCQKLNFGYTDGMQQIFEFSPVDLFGKKDKEILLQRTRLMIENELILTLTSQGSELAEMRLRNVASAEPGREMIRVEQYLDGRMRV